MSKFLKLQKWINALNKEIISEALTKHICSHDSIVKVHEVRCYTHELAELQLL